MKTFTFLFLVLILSCSMSLWTSCSDDNGKDDPVPPEQPTDSIVKDTTWLITKLNIGTDDNNGVLEYGLHYDLYDDLHGWKSYCCLCGGLY